MYIRLFPVQDPYDTALIHDCHAVAYPQDFIQVSRYQQDASACIPLPEEGFMDKPGGSDIQSPCGLAGHNQAGFLGYLPGKNNLLLVSAAHQLYRCFDAAFARGLDAVFIQGLPGSLLRLSVVQHHFP